MAFATPADIALRIGRDLTDAEVLTVGMLCELATITIATAADKGDEWATDLDPVPQFLRVMTIELVARAKDNWGGFSSTSETLGAYSYTQRYGSRDGVGGGLMLTRVEEALVRRVVWGRSSATTMPGSAVDQVIEYLETGDVTIGRTT